MPGELPAPLEVLELQDGQSVTFRVERWEVGEGTIVPRHAPQGKRVRILRVHVPPEDKPTFPHYWDITSTRLFAQLYPALNIIGALTARFTITAVGIPPKRNFLLERVRT